MPWQRHVLDVALELDPDTGLLAYREINLTVPRQSGKTLLMLCVMAHRANGFGPRQRILYTAQTRNDARRKWEDEHVEVLRASPFRSMFTVRKSNGSEAIRWKATGSLHGITSTTEKAGHGESLDLGVIDEAFAQEDDRLEQALKPAMITRPQPQLFVVSTAGTSKSSYLRSKVEAGRLRVDAGVTDSVAYFEWSAPDDADPADPATWRACMPALGHTVREEAIRADFESMKLADFRRAYLNQWPDEMPTESVIPQQTWAGLVDEQSQLGDPVAFAIDVNPDRSAAAIAVAGKRRDGALHVEIVQHERGTGWVVPRIAELVKKWRPCAVVADAAGPVGSLIAPLKAVGIDVLIPSVREVTQGCGQLFDAAMQGQLRHLNQPALNSALGGARKRSLGDAWAWARAGTSTDISPLVAVTLASWGHAVKGHEHQVDVAGSVW